MHATPTLQFFKKHGQQVDYKIAAAMEITLPELRTSLSDLSAHGEFRAPASPDLPTASQLKGCYAVSLDMPHPRLPAEIQKIKN
jgi:hypothetical protein